MKKVGIIIVAIAVLIAAWLGGAWYTGTRIEARTGDVVERLNTAWAKNPTPGGKLQVKQVSYERGLLSSRAHFALAIDGSPLGNDPVMEYDVAFSHGPFPLAALKRGQLSPQQFQAHVEMLTAGPIKMMAGALMGGKPLLVVDIGCSYGNHCTGTGSVPQIDVDLGPIAKNGKLTFGGVQMQFDVDHHSDIDYKGSVDMRLLPLAIGGHEFGDGQIAVVSDAQSVTETISWKNDKGASKFTLALTATKPISALGEEAASLAPEELAKLIKTASFRMELSRPMAIDMVARVLNLTQGVDLEAARKQIDEMFDAALAGNQDTLQTEGDLLISDWQYADGKLTVNGKERPDLLEQFKQSFMEGAQRHPGAQTPPAAAGGDGQAAGADDGDENKDDDGSEGGNNGNGGNDSNGGDGTSGGASGASGASDSPGTQLSPGAAATGGNSGVVRAPAAAIPGAATAGQADGGGSGAMGAPVAGRSPGGNAGVVHAPPVLAPNRGR